MVLKFQQVKRFLSNWLKQYFAHIGQQPRYHVTYWNFNAILKSSENLLYYAKTIFHNKGPFTNTCKGGPEKNYHRFSIKNWVYMLFYGVDP